MNQVRKPSKDVVTEKEAMIFCDQGRGRERERGKVGGRDPPIPQSKVSSTVLK